MASQKSEQVVDQEADLEQQNQEVDNQKDAQTEAKEEQQSNIIVRGFKGIYNLIEWFALTFYRGFKSAIIFTPVFDVAFYYGLTVVLPKVREFNPLRRS